MSRFSTSRPESHNDREGIASAPDTSDDAAGVAGSRWLQAFCDVLERDDIDEETDFFSAGGYSLLVPQLLARYEELSGWRPPMSLIFDVSSPAALEKASAAGQGPASLEGIEPSR